jgi:hypothetical protein
MKLTHTISSTKLRAELCFSLQALLAVGVVVAFVLFPHLA